MTLGVAARGENAGAAVQAAILGAELLGRGAIGGFAVFAILDDQGHVQYRTTQRGGIGKLDLPQDWIRARYAAAISSGPDRPEPLEQFLPGMNKVGLVTGHRLPNTPDIHGTPLNQAVLARLAEGEAPQDAIDAALSRCPEIDAGLIAIDASGRIGFGNSARVARRADCGAAERRSDSAHIVLLHNSILSAGPFAEKLADLAWSHLAGTPTSTRLLFVRQRTPIHLSTRDRVHVTADGTITAIESANLRLQAAHRRATAIYLGSEIWQDGQLIGRAATELLAETAEGWLPKEAESPPMPIVMEAVRTSDSTPQPFSSRLKRGRTH
ncbi:DUF6963 family protein [Microvirga sp. M2]|uniref:DUF6963 family protein n=1 Tax=Microvirga sp. M2 TaxID=3073270 RepID=UPI0039C1BB2F